MFEFHLNPIESLFYSLALFIVSGLIVKLLQKIPLVKYIVP